MQAALYFARKRRRARLVADQDDDVALTLIQLSQDDGSTSIAINPARVSAFYVRSTETSSTSTRVHMVDGPVWDLSSSYAAVATALSAQGMRQFARANGSSLISLNPAWVSSVENFVSSTGQCIVWMMDEERYHIDETYTNVIGSLTA